jgi:hypothetical protein
MEGRVSSQAVCLMRASIAHSNEVLDQSERGERENPREEGNEGREALITRGECEDTYRTDTARIGTEENGWLERGQA